MAGSVNKVILVEEYSCGASLTELADRYDISVSTVRYHVLKSGKLRSRADGVRNAASAGKLGSGMRGKSRDFTKEHREAISLGRRKWAEKNARGVSVKPSGYVEYTRGPNKGRAVHVVVMENRLGRRLREDEHVHHIDGVKTNNEENNLALVTVSGHARLHRIQDARMGVERERDEYGRFC